MGLGAVSIGSISIESLSLPNHSAVTINNEVIGQNRTLPSVLSAETSKEQVVVRLYHGQ